MVKGQNTGARCRTQQKRICRHGNVGDKGKEDCGGDIKEEDAEKTDVAVTEKGDEVEKDKDDEEEQPVHKLFNQSGTTGSVIWHPNFLSWNSFVLVVPRLRLLKVVCCPILKEQRIVEVVLSMLFCLLIMLSMKKKRL